MGDNILAQVADKFFDVKENSRGLTVKLAKAAVDALRHFNAAKLSTVPAPCRRLQ